MSVGRNKERFKSKYAFWPWLMLLVCEDARWKVGNGRVFGWESPKRDVSGSAF
jgi:hypothetical protein